MRRIITPVVRPPHLLKTASRKVRCRGAHERSTQEIRTRRSPSNALSPGRRVRPVDDQHIHRPRRRPNFAELLPQWESGRTVSQPRRCNWRLPIRREPASIPGRGRTARPGRFGRAPPGQRIAAAGSAVVNGHRAASHAPARPWRYMPIECGACAGRSPSRGGSAQPAPPAGLGPGPASGRAPSRAHTPARSRRSWCTASLNRSASRPWHDAPRAEDRRTAGNSSWPA